MIKTAIIEDNKRYRDLLRTILSNADKIELIYESDNCQHIVYDLRKPQPDVVIMDIELPGKSGIEAVSELKRAFPDMKILMLTVFEDEDKIFGAIKAGADGYLLKKDSPQKILDSITEVYEGKSSMNGVIAKKVLEYFQKKNTVNLPEEYNLTKREQEILELLMEGFTYKEIAAKCFISVQTLNTHVKHTYQKLGVHSRAEISAKFRSS
jgi:DNA-binding NarL/FixJ family response regulator